MTQADTLRALLNHSDIIYTAGAYDALSAKLIESAGFNAVFTSGFAISASYLGFPDAELYTMTENLNVVRNIVNAVNIPVIADIDTGYGNAINVMRTVKEFENSGVAGIILEDQIAPKRCPICVSEAPEILDIPTAIGKIKAAVDARRNPNFIIIARTDASGKDAYVRAKVYIEAGADLIQPISKSFKNYEDLYEFSQKINYPLSIQVLSWLEQSLDESKLGVYNS
jgi:methylisocitrate lyase